MYIYRYNGEAVACFGYHDGWAIVATEHNGIALIPPWDIVSFKELWRLG